MPWYGQAQLLRDAQRIGRSPNSPFGSSYPVTQLLDKKAKPVTRPVTRVVAVRGKK